MKIEKMSETCQKLAFTHPIVVLKSGLKNNWIKKLDRVNRPQDNLGDFYGQEECAVVRQAINLNVRLLFVRTLFTFETVHSTFNKKTKQRSLNDFASFDERFYHNFYSEKTLKVNRSVFTS